MPRAIWSGSISFGLVNVPVRLHSATQQKDVRFHQFERETGERIRQKRVAEDSGHEVDYDDIVKGYEISKGRFVMVTPEELESVEPGQSRTIDIEDFIEFTEVDPVHYEKTYYLEPEDSQGAKRAYALLREAMASSGRVAIGRFVMRSKQYLAAIRPVDKVLFLETMFFPDEVRDPNALDNVPGKIELSDREKKVAKQLVESLTSEWDPDRYQDTYREAVLDLVKRKDEGEDVVVEKPKEAAAPVTDLLAALEASINEAKERRASSGSSSGSSSSKSSSKKASASKSTRSTRKSSTRKSAAKKKTAARKAS
ncbi:MAG TPA: Ku protein [Acidimicrobiales bacterium]|nr:Ku protein [Acidimicrobiales bacterium]